MASRTFCSVFRKLQRKWDAGGNTEVNFFDLSAAPICAGDYTFSWLMPFWNYTTFSSKEFWARLKQKIDSPFFNTIQQLKNKWNPVTLRKSYFSRHQIPTESTRAQGTAALFRYKVCTVHEYLEALDAEVQVHRKKSSWRVNILQFIIVAFKMLWIPGCIWYYFSAFPLRSLEAASFSQDFRGTLSYWRHSVFEYSAQKLLPMPPAGTCDAIVVLDSRQKLLRDKSRFNMACVVSVFSVPRSLLGSR